MTDGDTGSRRGGQVAGISQGGQGCGHRSVSSVRCPLGECGHPPPSGSWSPWGQMRSPQQRPFLGRGCLGDAASLGMNSHRLIMAQRRREECPCVMSTY